MLNKINSFKNTASEQQNITDENETNIILKL